MTYGEGVTTSVAQVVGAGARKLRLGAGVTLEEMAKAANSYGLPWTSGRVGDFEAGRVAPSLPTLLAAAAALSHVIGRPVSLADLFAGKERVQINDSLSLDTSALRAILSGEQVLTKLAPLKMPTLSAEEERRLRERSRELTDAVLMDILNDTILTSLAAPELRREVLRDFSESDVRMCKSLGVQRELGAAAMAALWGRTFTAERNHRAGPAANAQKRGQVSRQLKAELQGALHDGHH